MIKIVPGALKSDGIERTGVDVPFVTEIWFVVPVTEVTVPVFVVQGGVYQVAVPLALYRRICPDAPAVGICLWPAVSKWDICGVLPPDEAIPFQ